MVQVLAVNQDPLGVQGSLVNSGGDDASPCGACETYIKPLHDGSFAVVLLNKGEAAALATASFGRRESQSVGNALRNDFRPAGCTGDQVCGFVSAKVRDLWARQDLGVYSDGFVNITVEPHGAAMLRVTPLQWRPPPAPPAPPPVGPCHPVSANVTLRGNICQPSGLIGTTGAHQSSVDCCLDSCKATADCMFASFEPPTGWCIRYSACTACNASSGCGDCSKYTTYGLAARRDALTMSLA